MKQTHSRSFKFAARAPVAAACAVILGAAAAFAQTTGTSTRSGTSSNTDRYGTGSTGSTSSTNDEYNRNRSTQTNASTSGAAAGSQAGSTSSDRTSTIERDRSVDRDRSGTSSTYDRSTDRTTREAYGSTGKLAWRERRFVTKAADQGMSELNLAQLAAEKASNPEVRSYAQKLVEDHQKVHSELTTLAGQKNVKLDTDDDGKDRTYRRLNNKSGREFDEEFVEHMIEMHEDDVKMFEKMASDAKDSELRSFASKHIDHLREHLQQAQSLRQSIMPTGRDEESSGRNATGTGSSTSSGNTRGTNDPSETSTFGTGTIGTGSSDASSSNRGSSSGSDTSTSGSNPRGNR